jgi:oxygen-dependent protoporphyrinogen oxidase
VSGIEEELRQLGCEVRLACPALGIRRADTGSSYVVDTPDGEIAADGIVVAVPAGHAAALLANLAPEAAVQLSTITYGSVVVVTFAVDGPLPALLDGWTGVLVPRIEGRLTTAVTLLSVKWPWTSTDYPDQRLVRVSAGRNGDTRIAALNDADLGRNLAQELAELTGITVPPERPRPTAEARAPATATSVSPLAHPLPPEGRPTTCHVQRWDESFPQYAPGHAARIGIVQRALAQQGGIALAGAALGGIGIPACITSGERAAALVSAAVAASA